MIYIVASHIDGAAFTNDKQPEPSEWYAEEYEEGDLMGALSYFFDCLDFAIENRKAMTEGGAQDYKAFLFTLENEEDDTPRRFLFNFTLTPSGVLGVGGETQTNQDTIIRRVIDRHGGKYAITAEPVNEGQCREYLRIRNKREPAKA